MDVLVDYQGYLVQGSGQRYAVAMIVQSPCKDQMYMALVESTVFDTTGSLSREKLLHIVNLIQINILGESLTTLIP